MTSFIKTCVTLLLVYLLVALTNDVAAQTTVGLVQKDTGTTEKGYILFAPLADTTTYLIDKCGRKIHTWHSSYKPGASVYLEPNGYLLRAGTYFNPLFPAGGSGGIVQVLDWNSNVTGAYIVSDSIYQSHHDVRALPNGNILVLAWERKTTAEAIAAGRNPLHAGSSVWSEAVLELHPVSDKKATVVWEWHLWDHLVQDFDATKPNYAAVASRPGRIDINYTPKDTVPDWVHLNAIDYNPAFDQVMINSPNFNELYIIDHSTTTAEARTGKGGRYGKGGNILYRWGNPLVYKSGTQADQQLFFQHNAHWIEPGLPYANQIMVFNNGQGRNGGINDYSTVDIIIPP
ncbi:MAG TPA: aryl-sulfate sulfotransferase, partial [Panacibacter sp.]|nr:aryl-sulfate sulfotransferase [Panacibacter sp.]